MKILLRTLLALAAVGGPVSTAAASVDAVPGELIVKLRPGVPAKAFGRPLALPRTAIARVPLRADLHGAAARLEADPRVVWAQPNVYQHGGSMPDDALYSSQWSLPAIGAPAAWDHTTGSDSVRVAIVDSGVNFDEPDLRPNLSDDGWDFVQDDDDPSDNVGHGTHVAGIVAARGNNGIGVAGVAWHTSLIPVRVLDNTNVGTCSQIASGMAYAVEAGARVVNLSLGSPAPCRPEEDVIESAPDVLFVIAAMNDSADVDATGGFPCAFPAPNIICVAATDESDRLASFSNYGAQSVDLAAPGDNILSSFMTWGPKDSLFSDGFESALPGRWVTGGSPDTWDRSFTYWRSGSWSLSDSPSGQYANGTDNYAQLTAGLDLTGKRDCAASVYARTALADGDLVVSDVSPDGVQWGHRLSALGGTSNGFQRWLIDLSPLEGRATGGLRFRLLSDGSGTGEGVALDDLEVFCVPPITGYTGAPAEFDYDWGTSMAAPHVSGTAALLLSLAPQLTPAQLKQLILATVDPLATLSGTTVSHGRLDAGDAVGLLAQALAQAAAPPPANPEPPAQAPPDGGRPAPDVAGLLAADLRASTRGLRIRDVLRRRGVTVRLRHGYPAGRFGLLVTDAHRHPLARGRSASARLTRAGSARLRHAHRIRLRFALSFTPSAGRTVVAARAVVLRR